MYVWLLSQSHVNCKHPVPVRQPIYRERDNKKKMKILFRFTFLYSRWWKKYFSIFAFILTMELICIGKTHVLRTYLSNLQE